MESIEAVCSGLGVSEGFYRGLVSFKFICFVDALEDTSGSNGVYCRGIVRGITPAVSARIETVTHNMDPSERS